MILPFSRLLDTARQHGFAVGAFNIYNLEGVLAVVRAAETLESPVILQVLPSALAIGGRPFLALCRSAAEQSAVPMAVHLDHCPDAGKIRAALDAGVSSVMADGSGLPFAENCRFTADMAALAKRANADVEGELGFLAGTEDGESADLSRAALTRPGQATEFVRATGVAALAVCIGNRHGHYPEPPQLDFQRLAQIRDLVDIPLVLHGTSGLPDRDIQQAISLGVCKFNVNTEVRTAYTRQLRTMVCGPEGPPELVRIMSGSIEAMQAPVESKIRLFGSAGTAVLYTPNP